MVVENNRRPVDRVYAHVWTDDECTASAAAAGNHPEPVLPCVHVVCDDDPVYGFRGACRALPAP